jgi:putative phosphoesterase
MRRVGLVSDTHGLLRPELLAFLRGCDHIVHGGDLGGRHILDELAAIAPVTAVRGNNDAAPWAHDVPETALVELDGWRLYAIHDLAEMPIDPAGAGVRVVVSGHSHRPLVEERGGVLYVNPGSAGPRRFRLPVCAAELLLDGGRVRPRIVDLLPA